MKEDRPAERVDLFLVTNYLVPKLCLGTQVGKLCFPDSHATESISQGRLAEAELRDRRSQAELGNEMGKTRRNRLDSHEGHPP
jgi:hypothetical protein